MSFCSTKKQGIWISWMGRSVWLYPSLIPWFQFTQFLLITQTPQTLEHCLAYFRCLIKIFFFFRIGVNNWNLVWLSLVAEKQRLSWHLLILNFGAVTYSSQCAFTISLLWPSPSFLAWKVMLSSSSVILKKLSADHLHFLAHNEMCHIFVSIFFYLKMI